MERDLGKKMKKKFCIVLIISLIFTFASCGKAAGGIEEEAMNPTMTVDAFLKALQARDIDAIRDIYAGDAEDFDFTKDIDDPLAAELVDKLVNKVLDFDYVLDNEQIDGDTASVDVHFKTYDVGSIISDLIDEVISGTFTQGLPFLGGGGFDSSQFTDLIREKIDEVVQNAEKVSDFKVTVKLVRKNGVWLVKDMNNNDDFIQKLFGGLKKISGGLDTLFG